MAENKNNNSVLKDQDTKGVNVVNVADANNANNPNTKKKVDDRFKEEKIQKPWVTVVKTFASNKLSMIALLIFLAIFIFMLVAPFFFTLDESYNEPNQKDLPPQTNYLKFPDAVKQGARSVDVGSSFSVAADKDGKVHVWGHTSSPNYKDLHQFQPQGMKDIVKVSAGFDHILALDKSGKVWAWGYSRQGATRIPPMLKSKKAIDIQAGNQISLALFEDGTTGAWGNTMNMDYFDNHEYQGQVKKLAVTGTVVSALLKDGSLAYLGSQNNSFSKPPAGKYTDITGLAQAYVAIREDGKLVDWGNTNKYRDGKELPVFDAAKKPVAIDGGLYHFMILHQDKTVSSFGKNDLKQSNVPNGLTNVSKIASGYYQNYFQNANGELTASGLKGYILGTDDFGRDILNRIVNGGRLSLTIGSLAVVISTVIAMILGGISGYFGGWADMLIQRAGEIISSLPFLPTVILLNSIIGNKIGNVQRVYLIMVLLGLLGWFGLMRLIRAQILSLREQEFVTAARALGIKEMNIVFQHIIPNVISIIIVSATLSFAGYLLYESTLSFLGFGVMPPKPTWGNMLNGANNSSVIKNNWWRWVFPSLILSICVICINLIGTGLDDAIDPKSQER